MSNIVLLENETVINLTTIGRVRLALDNKAINPSDDAYLKLLIGLMSGDAMRRLMKRAVEKKARIDYFNTEQGQFDYYVLGSPIDRSETITGVETSTDPSTAGLYIRDFSETGDVIDEADIFVDPAMAEMGIVRIRIDYGDQTNNLKISYNGGMASSTAITGTNGATNETTTFTSAGKDFTDLGVSPGDTLYLGTNATAADRGAYPITAVGTTTLTLLTAPSGTDTGIEYEIIDGGDDTIVGDYTDLADAVDIQIAAMWKQRGSEMIRSEGMPGASITWNRPVAWLGYIRAFIENNYGRKD